MKKILILLTFLSAFSFTSCFVTTKAIDAVSTSLSGADKKGIPQKKNNKKSDNPGAMYAITSDSDITLISDFFPTALKMYEIVQSQNPNHLGLKSMTGSLNVMYANAFVQSPADLLPIEEFDKQNDEYIRAKAHYLKGRDFCMDALDGRHKGFKDLIESAKDENVEKAVSMLDKNDVATAYWMGAGWLGAFSLDPLDAELLGNLSAPVLVLEKANEIDPEYSEGAILEVLARFYASAPESFGGSMERAMELCDKALELSEGKTPNPYIIRAECFCIPTGDEEGFIENLNKALEINPDDNPASRLTTTISQKKAKKLLESKGDYFLEW
ncbi:MAG: TRAP transporter TatT component family protein [Treponema sp.]|nr:TRAP transporter TatT component family protein [Treponema sp.]